MPMHNIAPSRIDNHIAFSVDMKSELLSDEAGTGTGFAVGDGLGLADVGLTEGAPEGHQ
jgi:hypothetical protein